jgi:hypothetical protein
MMKNRIVLSGTFVYFCFLTTLSWACPFCSENLAKNSAGFGGGLSLGIMITIFLLLGMVGSAAGLIVYLMIREGKKSDRRHELAKQASSNA